MPYAHSVPYGARLVGVVSRANRGMRALGKVMGRRGFGYVTATVASYFVARDADTDEGELAGAKQLDALRREIEALRHAIEGLSSSGHAP